MQRKDSGVLDRGSAAIQGVRDRDAAEMPRTLGQREKIWVIADGEIEFKKGHFIQPFEFFPLEAQYLMRARALARQARIEMVEFPRGVKPRGA